ncbi:MAG: ribonuclease H-like domain-containing protein [Lachnospiraceae bacterium]|nr:ribonuclease H-like domain-containing protein [Lachnospiraceae bacterium]
MKIIEETLENFIVEYPLEEIASPERILFIDIETTGFTARSSNLYLIGCAYFQAGKWRTIQWFAEKYDDEKELIESFFEFASLYTHLIHFNGNNFDLPYIEQKCKMLCLDFSFKDFTGIDIYRRTSPYKFILKIPNCKQKTIEQYLGIDRTDTFSGGELISLYHEYVKEPTSFREQTLLLHNEDDLKGMLNIVPILAYYDLFNSEVVAKKVQANVYKDFDESKKKELLINFHIKNMLKKPISAQAEGIYLKASGHEGTVKIPIFEAELKYYYSNYKDYYYLPDEDVALHRSVATFVDKEHRVRAKAENCYTRKYSEYLREWDFLFTPFFKKDYQSKEIYFELTDEIKRDREVFSKYASHILEHMAHIL